MPRSTAPTSADDSTFSADDESLDSPVLTDTTPSVSAKREAKDVATTPLTLEEDYSGQGGTYILDSATGIRTLVERTLPHSPQR
jgi:hypothetical protein